MERKYNDNPRKPSYRSSSSNYSNFTRNSSQTKKVGISTAVSFKEHNHGESNDCPIVGTCPFMCPEKEGTQRERVRDLATFERLYGNPSKSSSTLALKKFCRTISAKDVQPTDLRPLPVLEDTLSYLMKLLDSSDQPFEVVHDFIFDRTRSIRQDLSMQCINNDQVIYMYEKMVRFHIISHHKLSRCAGDSTIISSIHHLNKEQLTKFLASLYNLYDVNRTSECVFDNEAEFRSLYVLLHLDSQSHSMAAEATCLQFYIIEHYVNKVWEDALECINSSGYKPHPYPLTSLSKILMIKEADLEALCHACGLVISEDDTGNKVLPTKQTSFNHPKGGSQIRDSSLLELLGK